MEAQLHYFRSEEQPLEKIVMSGDHCDHVHIAPALCKTIQRLFKVNVRQRVEGMLQSFHIGIENLFVALLLLGQLAVLTEMKDSQSRLIGFCQLDQWSKVIPFVSDFEIRGENNFFRGLVGRILRHGNHVAIGLHQNIPGIRTQKNLFGPGGSLGSHHYEFNVFLCHTLFY